MRKLTILAIVCLLCITVFCACTDKDNDVSENKNTYVIDMKLDGETLTCSQTVTLTNEFKEGLDSLTFMLYPNAYAENVKNRAYFTKLKRYGGINVTRLTVNGAEMEFELGEENQYMNFAVAPAALGAEITIGFEYVVTLPESALRLGKIDNYYNISNFYPQLAVYGEEGFRKDLYTTVGDPVYSGLADFQVNVDVPMELIAACSGVISAEKTAEGRKTFTVVGENMRDFAMVLNADYQLITEVWNDVVINYYHTGEENAGAHAKLAVDAIKVFSENFGEYPYSVYSVAVTPFTADGMEFSGLVYISTEASDIENTIIHETAHQWWYNLVGSDNINAGWLDEGLTTFTTAYYYLLTGDEVKYNTELQAVEKAYFKYEKIQKLLVNGGAVTMTKSIYDYTEYQYNMLAYNKGCLMFKNLYETAGMEKFNKALNLYVKENRFKTATSAELSDAFGKAMKCDVSGLINGWLTENVVLTAFAG